jgi:hypothetical protein
MDAPVSRDAAVKRLMLVNDLTGKQARDLVRFQEAHARQQPNKEDPGVVLPDPLTRQCSWCDRVWDEETKKWVTSEPIGKVTHGMCYDCQARLKLDTQ